MVQYKVPEQYYFRIHHVRPRFKNNLEDVLFFVADTISSMGKMDSEAFALEVNEKLRSFPGNVNLKEKTISNWRTEISAIFGFIETGGGNSWPGRRAVELSKDQDLIRFFKLFLFSFQYPGAHVKKQYVSELIEHQILFKPAQYILNLLDYARSNFDSEAYLTKEETCHCIFNDLRCTRDNEPPSNVWSRIIANRHKDVTYDSTGDVIRYAGDIIDYMEVANLLSTHDYHKYYLNESENATILRFIKSKEYYNGYDQYIKRGYANYSQITELEPEWFSWVNRDMAATDFATEITAVVPIGSLTPDMVKAYSEVYVDPNMESTAEEYLKTTNIGTAGEAIVYGHECQFLKIHGREDLIHLVKKIPTNLALGYDIASKELDESSKAIEVKTTVSSNALQFARVHLTPNEWRVADSMKKIYYIYRLMISLHGGKKLFVVRDPVGLYKQDKLSMIPGKDGVELILSEKTSGEYVEVLTWTD